MRRILFFTILISLAFTINFVEAKSVCPDLTSWDGTNCVNTETGESITYTDYFGNAVNKSNESQEIPTQEIIITAPKHEILRDLMIIVPEIAIVDDQSGKALEQKIEHDKQGPTNLDRSNYDFGKVIKWTTKNAEIQFQKIVLGKHVQNSDFGKNDKRQIEYTKRYERYEDPVLQYNLIKENYLAQKMFLINWGNFSNN